MMDQRRALAILTIHLAEVLEQRDAAAGEVVRLRRELAELTAATAPKP